MRSPTSRAEPPARARSREHGPVPPAVANGPRASRSATIRPGQRGPNAGQSLQLNSGGTIDVEQTISGCPGPADQNVSRRWGSKRGAKPCTWGCRLSDGLPLKVRCGARVRSSPGPDPGHPVQPLQATERRPWPADPLRWTFASARPTRGRRASSAGDATSASTSSPACQRPGLVHGTVALRRW